MTIFDFISDFGISTGSTDVTGEETSTFISFG
jgi:hypothetical protein